MPLKRVHHQRHFRPRPAGGCDPDLVLQVGGSRSTQGRPFCSCGFPLSGPELPKGGCAARAEAHPTRPASCPPLLGVSGQQLTGFMERLLCAGHCPVTGMRAPSTRGRNLPLTWTEPSPHSRAHVLGGGELESRNDQLGHFRSEGQWHGRGQGRCDIVICNKNELAECEQQGGGRRGRSEQEECRPERSARTRSQFTGKEGHWPLLYPPGALGDKMPNRLPVPVP